MANRRASSGPAPAVSPASKGPDPRPRLCWMVAKIDPRALDVARRADVPIACTSGTPPSDFDDVQWSSVHRFAIPEPTPRTVRPAKRRGRNSPLSIGTSSSMGRSARTNEAGCWRSPTAVRFTAHSASHSVSFSERYKTKRRLRK